MYTVTYIHTHIRQYYRWAPAPGVAADEPLPDLAAIVAAADAPHGRETLP